MRDEPTYALSSWLFLRALGFIYFTAFASLAVQVRGLIGSKGIIPAIDILNRYRAGGLKRMLFAPTIFWVNASDRALSAVCWLGAGLSVLLMLDVASLPILILVWVFYLSLFAISGPFLGYQWDILLIEAGFLAIFLAPSNFTPQFPPATAPPPVLIFLFWWLLFRLMWSSGWTKISSGDRRWRDLTALTYHYETQPLPTTLSWYMHQLPLRFHRMSTAIVLFIELAVPFFIPVPALRPFAAACFVALMVLIELTGNYAFFNLLGMALCLPLLNDALIAPFLGVHDWQPAHASTVALGICVIPLALILVLSISPVLQLFRRELSWPPWIAAVLGFLYPFRLVNNYGLFSVMTVERPELIIETSENGSDWTQWEFKAKPGNVNCPPRFVAPHQPRLDWQMWFAAMGFYHNHTWVRRLMLTLAERNPEITKLLQTNPFGKDVRYIRCVVYDYRFTNRAERAATGAWWRRERRGLYAPEIDL
jgi:hypothetical protein